MKLRFFWHSRALSRVGLFTVLLCCWATSAVAQSISLAGSSVSQREADDYFTLIQQNPKDMNDVCDAGLDQFKNNLEYISNGVWNGVHNNSAAPIMNFMAIPTIYTNLAVWRDCATIEGIREKPIDPSRFTEISWSHRTDQPSFWSVMFVKDANDFITRGFDSFDGYRTPANGTITYAPDRWTIHQESLASRAPANYPWTGLIRGLALWPSLLETAGHIQSIDWIRVYNPSTQGYVPLSWSSSGASNQFHHVTIYVDSDNSGFDGIPVKHALPVNGSYNLGTGFLPPGRYYFYVGIHDYSNATDPQVSHSGYMGPVVINGKPYTKFVSPSRMSGPEYARDVRGDAWDMNQSTDVENFTDANGNLNPPVMHGIQAFNFTNGYLNATTLNDPVGGTTDTQVHFRTAQGRPVDTTYYRWFCAKMQVNPNRLPRDGNSTGLYDAGWVARFMWERKSQRGTTFGSTVDHELVERSQSYPDYANGFVTYCFDLNDPTGHFTGSRWGTSPVDVIRFDPLEAKPATDFTIDSAGLYAENTDTLDRTYDITLDLKDPENDGLTVQLYYDTNKSGDDGTLIGTYTNQLTGQRTYRWNTTNVPRGDYYIYAVLTDSFGNATRFYSDVIVQVKQVEARREVKAPCGDLDGDGRSDMHVARAANANLDARVYTRSSSTGLTSERMLGNIRRDIIGFHDFDGDLVSDPYMMVTYFEAVRRHFFTNSGDSQTTERHWGIQSDRSMIGDYDGDGKADIAVQRDFDGSWWIWPSSGAPAYNRYWGVPGDIPAPADYDGDGKTDIAVFRPSTGEWFALIGPNGDQLLLRQFGLNGDHPMPGDYDGDGRADFAVFRPYAGMYFVCPTAGSSCTGPGVAYELPGAVWGTPIEADYDGDGSQDPAVWMPDGRFIYRFSSTGTTGVTPYGLPGDRPLCEGKLTQIAEIAALQQPIPPPPPPPAKKKKKRRR